jgi:hypothetical protein
MSKCLEARAQRLEQAPQEKTHAMVRLIARWARRKFKRLRLKTKGARDWFARLRRTNPTLFAHWQLCHGNGRASGAV